MYKVDPVWPPVPDWCIRLTLFWPLCSWLVYKVDPVWPTVPDWCIRLFLFWPLCSWLVYEVDPVWWEECYGGQEQHDGLVTPPLRGEAPHEPVIKLLKYRKLKTMLSSFSSNHPVQLILLFKSSWCTIASAARNWINSVPQTAATTFAFSSRFILLLCFQRKLAFYEVNGCTWRPVEDSI